MFEAVDYVIRPLEPADEPILWEMLYQALHTTPGEAAPPPEIVRRPEFARYVEGWGRPGDTGFVAHDAGEGLLLGAVWLRLPTREARQSGTAEGAIPELAFAVKSGHRGRGIGTALLTQLVRANPQYSAVSLNATANKPVLRLYERFGFRVVEQSADAIILRREP
ncbi:MAG: N-acetyltransferase family protein [Chthoniobacterales bacterium]